MWEGCLSSLDRKECNQELLIMNGSTTYYAKKVPVNRRKYNKLVANEMLEDFAALYLKTRPQMVWRPGSPIAHWALSRFWF